MPRKSSVLRFTHGGTLHTDLDAGECFPAKFGDFIAAFAAFVGRLAHKTLTQISSAGTLKFAALSGEVDVISHALRFLIVFALGAKVFAVAVIPVDGECADGENQ